MQRKPTDNEIVYSPEVTSKDGHTRYIPDDQHYVPLDTEKNVSHVAQTQKKTSQVPLETDASHLDKLGFFPWKKKSQGSREEAVEKPWNTPISPKRNPADHC